MKSCYDVFLAAHDPTTLIRQGADEGTQYRSVILYPRRRAKTWRRKKSKAGAQKKFSNTPIVTENRAVLREVCIRLENSVIRDFIDNNTNYGYCRW